MPINALIKTQIY